MRSSFLLLILSVLLSFSSTVLAQTEPCHPTKSGMNCSGAACATLGESVMEYDRKNIIFCLANDVTEPPFIWKSVTSGGGGSFGTWTALNINVSYTAASDGFVVGNFYKTTRDHTGGYVQLETPVGTVRQRTGAWHSEWGDIDLVFPIMIPVKKGDTYIVRTSGSWYGLQYLYFLSSGS